jgi:chemotaxis protein methyltransferase CheR
VFAEVRRHMTADGYLLLGNAEQAEDSTKLFQVQFASGCYVYRPANGA